MYGLRVDRTRERSASQQLTQQLREAIHHQHIKGGEKLPPTRQLAKELGVARNVIIQVYEQLLAEGYLESRVGAGTFVTNLPNAYRLQNKTNKPSNVTSEVTNLSLKSRIAFRVGHPDPASFPKRLWAKLLKEVCLDAPDEAFAYGPVEGEARLRRAIADYLFRTKNILCRAEQIIILSGTTQGVDLIAKFFRHTPGVCVEDPGDGFTPAIFTSHGLTTYPISVDGQGMRIEALESVGTMGLVYIVPSHQFPLGGVLPIQRRLSLVNFAEEHNVYIIEDDYDSEFRYQGEPIPSLRSLAPNRVIYLGTFSKTLSPALRLSFAIIPDALNEEFLTLKERLNMRNPIMEQLAMASFLETKAMDRHVYKMKRIYSERRKLLIETLQEFFGKEIKITGENAGMHLVVDFPEYILGPPVYQAFREHGVEVEGVEEYTVCKGSHQNQLVFGYGALKNEQIIEGVHRIHQAMLAFRQTH